LDAGTPLLLLDGADRLTGHQRSALAERLRHLAKPIDSFDSSDSFDGFDGFDGHRHRPAVVLGCTSPAAAAPWNELLPAAGNLDLPDSHPLLEVPR
jgi:hypothetical protein